MRFAAFLRKFKKRIVQEAMRKSGDNCAEAARMLGVHPNYLHRLVKKLGVKGEAE